MQQSAAGWNQTRAAAVRHSTLCVVFSNQQPKGAFQLLSRNYKQYKVSDI